MDFFREKKNMYIAKKHKRILFREVHFWNIIWSGRGDGFRAGIEMWDDGNINNGDGSKGRCPDRFFDFSISLKYVLRYLQQY